MSESDMFPDNHYSKCGKCRKEFYPETSVSLDFCSEECVRSAVREKHHCASRADRYFVQLRDAETQLKELKAQIDFHFGTDPNQTTYYDADAEHFVTCNNLADSNHSES